MTGGARNLSNDHTFPKTWSARILAAPPLIAPARQFVLPRPVPGEEDALARGALYLLIKPAGTAPFLATCALGFRDPVLPSGLWSCPHPEDVLAIAGGYGYLIRTTAPETSTHLHPRPITAVFPTTRPDLLLLAGFHDVSAINSSGPMWRSARLSWEGVTLGGVHEGKLHGTGWHMQSDRELPFSVNLATGEHTGGGFP